MSESGGNPPPTTATIGCPDHCLTNGTQYYATVNATNDLGTGAESTQSPTVTPAGRPFPPETVQATAGYGFADVSWTPPSQRSDGTPGDNGSPITSYTVTASPGGRQATAAGSPAPTSARVDGLDPNTPYTFAVVATNDVGTSDSASSGPVTTSGIVPPDAPTDVAAQAGDGQATITWTASVVHNAPVRSYVISAYPGGAVTVVDAGQTSAVVSGLVNETAYTFTVTATSAGGSSEPSAASDQITPVQSATPNSPSDVTADPGNTSATVSWVGSSTGATVDHFRITASTGQTFDTPDGRTFTFTPSGFNQGDNETFQVSAVNSQGTSPPSSPSPQITIGAPSEPVASGDPGTTSVTLRWNAAAEHGEAVTAYHIVEIIAGGPGNTTCPCELPVDDVSGSTRSYTISGLQTGTQHTYGIVARSSNYSSIGAVVVLTVGAPATPTNVVATPANQSASVSWTAPSDNGSIISGYTLFVTETRGDGSQLLSTTPVPGDVTSFNVAPLHNQSSYTFAISATNGRGDGPASSPSAPVVPSVNAGPPSVSQVGLYGFGTTEQSQETTLRDGWGGIGSVDGFCFTASQASQAYACPTGLAPSVSQAFQATGSQGFWQSYWTLGAPHAGDTWQAAGFTAGQEAAQHLDSISGRHPDFVVLDPEGFGGSPTTETGTTQQKTADWQDWVTGWSQGIHSVDPNLTPALYTNESDILTYGLQNLGIPLFPAETPISGHTPSVLGDAVSGYIAYYATCPAGDDVAEVKGWGAGYNTVQFDRHTAYCGPQ